MKKVMLVGKTGCGKTTLSQRMLGLEVQYRKTQAIEVLGGAILDTPGEYLEQRGFYKALIVTAVQADVIVLVQDATDAQNAFSPGMAGMFPRPVLGVVTKSDRCGDPAQLAQAEALLRLAGARAVFVTGLTEETGLSALMDAIAQA